jgi:hypothetical protein
MATTWPSLLQFLDQGQLVVGLDLAMHLVDAQLGTDGAGGGEAVARGHDDAQAAGVQGADGLGRAGLDGIGHGQQASEAAIDRQVHDAGALAAQALGVKLQGRHIDAFLLHERGVAQRQVPPLDGATHADAAARLEVHRLGQWQALARVPH